MLVVEASGAEERCLGRAKLRRDRTRRGVCEARIGLRSGCRWIGDLTVLERVVSLLEGKEGEDSKQDRRRHVPRPDD